MFQRIRGQRLSEPKPPDIPDVRDVLQTAVRHIDQGAWAWAERDVQEALDLVRRLREMQPLP